MNRLQDAISEMQLRGDALRDQIEDPNRPATIESVEPLVDQIQAAARHVFSGLGDLRAVTS
jgi:hypothetical protein